VGWGAETAKPDGLGSTGRRGWLGESGVARDFTGLAGGATGLRPRGGFSDGRAFTLLVGVALRGAFVIANTFVRRTFVTPGVTLATIKG